MNPIAFKEHNCVFAKDQPEYLPLPAFRDAKGTVSCWKLTWWERVRLLFTGLVWCCISNGAKPLQPQRLTVQYPFIHNKKKK